VIHDGRIVGERREFVKGRERGGCGRSRGRTRADDPAVRVICHPGWRSDGGAARGGVVGSDFVLN